MGLFVIWRMFSGSSHSPKGHLHTMSRPLRRMVLLVFSAYVFLYGSSPPQRSWSKAIRIQYSCLLHLHTTLTGQGNPVLQPCPLGIACVQHRLKGMRNAHDVSLLGWTGNSEDPSSLLHAKCHHTVELTSHRARDGGVGESHGSNATDSYYSCQRFNQIFSNDSSFAVCPLKNSYRP